jgi:Cu/Ag efflux pump CusA
MMDGMVSSTVLSLCAIPALYELLKQWGVQRASRAAAID